MTSGPENTFHFDPIGWFVADHNGCILRMNPACGLIFRKETSHLLNLKFCELFGEPLRPLLLEKTVDEVKQENDNPSEVFFSGPAYTYNGFRINAIGLKKKRFFEFFLAEFTHGLPVDQRFTVLNQKLHELSAHIEAGMEQERKRMAREIHDGLGSSLSAIKMEMSVLKKILSHSRKFPKEAETVYRSMEQMIDGSVALVRKLVTELRPEVLDELGFVSTIQWYAGDFRLRTGIETEVTIFPRDFRLEPALSMSIYRVFQEIMNNISKHAQASRVTVFIRKHNDRLELRVRDNGLGIREDEAKNRRSFGIIGMQERTKLLNGQLSISGTPGKGTVIHLEVPLI